MARIRKTLERIRKDLQETFEEDLQGFVRLLEDLQGFCKDFRERICKRIHKDS